jgi:hypothetical protein
VLLGHEEEYRIVKSGAHGLAQHDPLTWLVQGADFLYATERTAFGKRTEQILDDVIRRLSPAHKKIFVQALFHVLAATEQESVSGILSNKSKSVKAILRGFTDLAPHVREVLIESVSAIAEANAAARQEMRLSPLARRTQKAE